MTAINAAATSGAMSVTVDGAKASYAGGSGVALVTLASTVVGKAVTGGGATTDVPTMNADHAAIASGSVVFAGFVSGFERLVLTGSSAGQVIDVAQLGAYGHVTAPGTTGAGLTPNNMAHNSTVVLTGTGTAYTFSGFVTHSATPALNLVLTDGSGAATNFASTGVTATGATTILNVTVTDSQATPTGAFLDALTVRGA